MLRQRIAIGSLVLGTLAIGGFGLYSYATSLRVVRCFPPLPPLTFEKVDISEETIQDTYRGSLQPKAGTSYHVELKITDRRVVETQPEKVFVLDGKITYFQHPTLSYETDFRINLTQSGSVGLTQLDFPAYEFSTPALFYGTLEAGESTGRLLLRSDNASELTLYGVPNSVTPGVKSKDTFPIDLEVPGREPSPEQDGIKVMR